MLSYLQTFNALPANIKQAVASPEAAARIAELGKKYKIDLAATVMRVMVKEIKLETLGAYLVNQFGLEVDSAKNLERELRKHVFSPVIDYLLGADAGPKLVFDESDEKEVKAAAQAVETGNYDQAIEEAVARVAEKARISFADPLVGGKFRQVIKTYLRQTRDKTAALETLTKAAELGGVALSRDAAERTLSLAGAELNELKKVTLPSRPKVPVVEDVMPEAPKAASSVPVAEYNLEASLREQGKLKPEAEPILDPEHELPPPPPAIITSKKVAPQKPIKLIVEPEDIPVKEKSDPSPKRAIIKEAISGKPIDKPALRKLANEPQKTIVNLSTSPSGKVKMDDIRYTPQVLSPIDELRYMTIKTFRRLHPEPKQAIEKIKEKLELLGRDEYGRKIEGIVAWQASPLNRLYLALCRQALDEGKPLSDVLSAELKREPASLKPNELEAIIALNRSLKF